MVLSLFLYMLCIRFYHNVFYFFLLLCDFMLICILFLSVGVCFFFFKQKTAYEMRISDWSSDVCSSDLSGKECPVLVARVTRQSAQQIGSVRLGASLIVTLGSSPGETPVVEIDRVAQWFGLTPAEARLAVALAAGDTLQDYAAMRSVSINAVRFLLKGIFRKTGVNSQAQLVALLARLPVPG